MMFSIFLKAHKHNLFADAFHILKLYIQGIELYFNLFSISFTLYIEVYEERWNNFQSHYTPV